jgi:uncharacterized protein with HEPN domain
MQLKAKKYLFDVVAAAREIVEFTTGKTLDDYLSDRQLQAAVERKFIVIGEALVQLSKLDRHISSAVPDCREIVAFRNLLVHGYSAIDPVTVWKVAAVDLATLISEVDKMLA